MTVIVRKFSASPQNDAVSVWNSITSLLCHNLLAARRDFESVIGGACSLISDQIPKDRPIVFRGTGPLLRIYCLYGDDAVTGDDANENSLNWNLIQDDWKGYLPCPKDQIDAMRSFLSQRSKHFDVYDSKEVISFSDEDRTSSRSSNFKIDEEALRSL